MGLKNNGYGEDGGPALVIQNIENNGEDILSECIADRRLVLDHTIDEGVLQDYILYILKWNHEDKDIPAEKRKKIYLYINCLGGDLVDGFSLVDVILASKTPVVAISFGSVASMAYYIYICCHHRYALPNSVFLQHDGAVGIAGTNAKAKDTMAFIDNLNDRVKRLVLGHTTMSDDMYDSIYEKEYYMFPDEAQKLGVVDKIIGVDCDIDEILGR